MTIQRILIANRGEIACRIIRSISAEGLTSIAVFSDGDIDAPHVRMADEAVCIGPANVSESYLHIDRVIDAAKQAKVDAIHPGYGFLSENSDFAQRVLDSGITWIGPPPSAILSMGDKAEAKANLKDSKVPMAAGYHGSQDKEILLKEANRIGYPLLIKATAGGGGRGIRLVENSADFNAALLSARSEAKNAFGNDTVMLEQYITKARHVEVQILADQHGNVIHLFERDCSAQRRRQKIIEEAPCPVMSTEERAAIGAAAVRAAQAISYEGAGTVEFLVNKGQFYFLEMNTRLQVEHPVTEMITGHDLVSWQLKIIMGAKLPPQEDIQFCGHAIEARIYAEDPYNNFLPQTGHISLWDPYQGKGRRVDSGIQQGQIVRSHYDPMLAKIICWGADRASALRRLKHSILNSTLIGVPNNRSYLLQLLDSQAFRNSDIDTGWVDGLNYNAPIPEVNDWIIAAWLFSPAKSTWNSRGPSKWTKKLLSGDDAVHNLEFTQHSKGIQVHYKDQSYTFRIIASDETSLRAEIDGWVHSWRWILKDRHLIIDRAGHPFEFTEYNPIAAEASGTENAHLIAPMTGRIVAIHVENGQKIETGDVALTMEAMKMEHPIRAGMSGVVSGLSSCAGDQVRAKQILGTLLEEN